jgi:6-phosphogluconolactonase
MTFTIVDKKENLERTAIEIIKNAIQKINKKNIIIGLSGGRSTAGIYNKLSKEDLPWKKIHFFLVDERITDKKSDKNGYMIKKSLINNLVKHYKFPIKNFHLPISANQYSKEFHKYNKFDIIILGVGEDCHIASLFPYKGITSTKNEFIVVESPKKPPIRITATKNMLKKAKCGIALFLGSEKKKAYKKYITADDENECPAHIIRLLKNSFILTDNR